jgi:hypothetical protein
MNKQLIQLSRRDAVRAIGCCLAVGLKGWAQPAAVRYSVVVRPERILLGDPVVANLSCVALQNGVDAFTFEDGSLKLELKRLHTKAEPLLNFPNRTVTRQGSIELRTGQTGRERLTVGRRRQRSFELIRMFPRWILDAGEYDFSYWLGPDEHAGHAGPARITITSGPGAMSSLFALLAHEDEGVRTRAAGLLHRMTAHVTGYSAGSSEATRQEAADHWREWWRSAGQKMRWNYRSQGATFGGYVEGGQEGHGPFVGGLAYDRRSFEKVEAATIASILLEWLNNPSMGPDQLQGKNWVADERVTYPGEEVMVDPGPEIATRIASAIAQIPSRQTSAPIILATAMRMLDTRYIEPLSDLEHQSGQSAALQRVSAFAAGMLDVLDPGRTPIGA